MIRTLRRPRCGRATPWLLLACALLCQAAWPAGPTLTVSQLQRLLKVVDERGSRSTIPRGVASVLGLEANQYTPDIKQAAWQDDEGNKHGFGPLNDHSGYFMFRSRAAAGQSVFRVDPTLHLVKAARSLVRNGPVIALPQDEAQKELDDEFAQWFKVLTPGGPVDLPPKLPPNRSQVQQPKQAQ